jgi:hypothetical protein
MNQKKNIEHFRLNEYLGTYLFVNNGRLEDKVEMTFNDYAMHAFYSTSDDIADLENEKNFINNGRRTIISISLWFLALESYVNNICKITCLAKGKDFKALSKLDLGSRLTFLIQALEYDEIKIKQTGLYSRINEFKQFRNELFHDRNFQHELEFKKTRFSTIPFKSNQADTFQALLITLEVILLFRYCIPGIDLMPNISIGNSSILHFDKLEELYNKYLRVYFKETLSKHNLFTELNLDTDQFLLLEPSAFFIEGEIGVMERIEQADEFKHDINQATTSIGRSLYQKILSDYNLPAGHASGLNFVINWPKFYASMNKYYPGDSWE